MSLVSSAPSRSAWQLLELVWSWPFTFMLLVFALLPVYAPLMPTLEGLVRPVTGKIDFVDVQPFEDGWISFRMHYFKLQDCNFKSLTADIDGAYVPLVLVSGSVPATFPTGERVSQVWKLAAPNLDNLRIRWLHECHPYWNTITTAYP